MFGYVYVLTSNCKLSKFYRSGRSGRLVDSNEEAVEVDDSGRSRRKKASDDDDEDERNSDDEAADPEAAKAQETAREYEGDIDDEELVEALDLEEDEEASENKGIRELLSDNFPA